MEFTLSVPQKDEEKEPEELSFIIQLAPLNLVPHAVHLFLEQVEHGLWHTNAYFYLNGPHVFQAGPQLLWSEEESASEDEEAEEKNRLLDFASLDLDNLIFPDYSNDFPHKEWTLGFTGRPGGPDMYINKADNSISHGPGGQDQHALSEYGDSCFGIVTEGRKGLKKLFDAQVYEEEHYEWLLYEPIAITKATILTKKAPPNIPLRKTGQRDRNVPGKTATDTATGPAGGGGGAGPVGDFAKVTNAGGGGGGQPDSTPTVAMPPDAMLYQQKMAEQGGDDVARSPEGDGIPQDILDSKRQRLDAASGGGGGPPDPDKVKKVNEKLKRHGHRAHVPKDTKA